jgi:glutathione S-transferase
VITVYHLNSSRSERVVWLLEELGIPYRMETYRREANGAAPPAMKAIHGIGRSPIIHDGDTVLAESGRDRRVPRQRHGDGTPRRCRLTRRTILATSTGCISRGEPHARSC